MLKKLMFVLLLLSGCVSIPDYDSPIDYGDSYYVALKKKGTPPYADTCVGVYYQTHCNLTWFELGKFESYRIEHNVVVGMYKE